MFAEKETHLVAYMAKPTQKLPCSAIAFRMVAHADKGKKVLETLDVASTNSNCQREETARGTSPSFVDLVVFKIRGSALQSAFEMIVFTGR